MQARNFTIKEVPIPQVKDDEVLLKGTVPSPSPEEFWMPVFTWTYLGSYILWSVRSMYPRFHFHVGKLNSDGRLRLCKR